MKDTSKWTLSLKAFLLQQIGSIISQLQLKGKEDCLALPLEDFLSTLSEAEGLSVNVGWLKSRVTALRDLKKAGPSIHASLSSLHELRAKENSCINKAKEAESALQAQLEGVTAERYSLRKEVEKLEGELGALSNLDFSLENISSLTNII
nr:hypothetical protein CFP56_62990 [Quercus suber]